jgi:hypothetical protein
VNPRGERGEEILEAAAGQSPVWKRWYDVAWIRRLRFAWAFREWPWNIPASVVPLVGTRRPTDAEVEYFRRLHGLDTTEPSTDGDSKEVRP